MECEETLKSTVTRIRRNVSVPGTNSALCVKNELILGMNAVDVVSILRHYRYGSRAFMDWKPLSERKSFTEWTDSTAARLLQRALILSTDSSRSNPRTKTIRPAIPTAFEDVRYIHFDDTLTAEDYYWSSRCGCPPPSTNPHVPPAAPSAPPPPFLPMNKPGERHGCGAPSTIAPMRARSTAMPLGGIRRYRLPRFSKTSTSRGQRRISRRRADLLHRPDGDRAPIRHRLPPLACSGGTPTSDRRRSNSEPRTRP